MFRENVLPGTLGKENWHHCKAQSGLQLLGREPPLSGGHSVGESLPFGQRGPHPQISPHTHTPLAKKFCFLPNIVLEMITHHALISTAHLLSLAIHMQ